MVNTPDYKRVLLKWHWLAVILFVSLALIFIIAPQYSEAIASVRSCVLITPDQYNYVLTPIPPRIDNKRVDCETYLKEIPTAAAFILPPTYKYSTLNICTIFNWVISSNSLSTKGFQQVCHLLDIPPPSA